MYGINLFVDHSPSPYLSPSRRFVLRSLVPPSLPFVPPSLPLHLPTPPLSFPISFLISISPSCISGVLSTSCHLTSIYCEQKQSLTFEPYSEEVSKKKRRSLIIRATGWPLLSRLIAISWLGTVVCFRVVICGVLRVCVCVACLWLDVWRLL